MNPIIRDPLRSTQGMQISLLRLYNMRGFNDVFYGPVQALTHHLRIASTSSGLQVHQTLPVGHRTVRILDRCQVRCGVSHNNWRNILGHTHTHLGRWKTHLVSCA